MRNHGAYVYLIREGTRIKVGHSKSVTSRLRLFQTGNAEECHVVAAIWLVNADEIEKHLKDILRNTAIAVNGLTSLHDKL